MRPSVYFASAALVSLSLVASASLAQPTSPTKPPDSPAAGPAAPDKAPVAPGDALPPPDDEGVAASEQPATSPQPVAPGPVHPPPGSPAGRPPNAVPWYPAAVGPTAQYEPPPAEAEDEGPSRDMSKDFWQVYGGVRTSWIPSEGYNPFDDNDIFNQLSIGASRALVLGPQLSFAPGVMWEFGAVDAEARGARSELIVHRLGAVAEGRLHLGRDVYILAKVVPQAVHTRAYLSDDSSPAQLQQKTWRFGADATAGAAWNIPRTMGSPNVIPQFWLVGEVGYGWTMGKDLELTPDVDEDDPQARMKLNLGSMDLSGVMMRVNVAMTF